MVALNIPYCFHGAYPVSDAKLNSINNLADDVRTMCMSQPLGSEQSSLPKKTQRKVTARVTKTVSSFSSTKNGEEGASALRSLYLGWAANYILKGAGEEARDTCNSAINMDLICWETKSMHTDANLPAKVAIQRNQLCNEQGVVLYVANRIPCNCLREIKKQAKKLDQEAGCLGCEGCFPVSKLFYCACRIVSYCSEECQHKHWKMHKKECARWRKEQKLASAKQKQHGV